MGESTDVLWIIREPAAEQDDVHQIIREEKSALNDDAPPGPEYECAAVAPDDSHEYSGNYIQGVSKRVDTENVIQPPERPLRLLDVVGCAGPAHPRDHSDCCDDAVYCSPDQCLESEPIEKATSGRNEHNSRNDAYYRPRSEPDAKLPLKQIHHFR